MKAVVQRVKKASVKIGNKEISSIGNGLLIFLAIRRGDKEEQARWMAHKIANLRIFSDKAGKFNYSLIDIKGEALVVSQFTLYGSISTGFRPNFTEAASFEEAKLLYDKFIAFLKEEGIEVKTGKFGKLMLIEILNDGPVTIILEKNPSL